MIGTAHRRHFYVNSPSTNGFPRFEVFSVITHLDVCSFLEKNYFRQEIYFLVAVIYQPRSVLPGYTVLRSVFGVIIPLYELSLLKRCDCKLLKKPAQRSAREPAFLEKKMAFHLPLSSS
jgi:hypothetical protein